MTHAEQDAGMKGPDNAPGASAESPSLRRLYCSTVRTQVGVRSSELDVDPNWQDVVHEDPR